MRLTWSKRRERFHPDAHILKADKREVARVEQKARWDAGAGFFWYTTDRPDWLPFENTAATPRPLEVAKKDAADFVRRAYEQRESKP